MNAKTEGVICIALLSLAHAAISFATPTPSPTLLYPTTPSPTQTPMSTNITSHNQSGGFTGINQGTVNLGPQPRLLSADQGNRMIRKLAAEKPTSKINFAAAIGDEETKQYAEQINRVLIEGGIVYASVHTAGTALGIPSGVTIFVHDAKNPSRDAIRIRDCFMAEGHQFSIKERPEQDANTIEIWVQTRPTL
jgi:hypothetical protein